jgi:hypothetical protein
MKKTYFLTFLLFFSVAFSSCSKSDKEEKEEVSKVAETFLFDFYYNSFDYAKASADKTTRSFLTYLKKNDRQEYRSQRLDKIDSVSLLTKDSALVYYSYENSFLKKDKHILPLIKQNGKWLVHIENKNNSDFYRFVFDYSLTELKSTRYKKLLEEEVVEIDLFMSRFIKQVNHPKLVVGLLSASSVTYYDITDIENYDESFSYFWQDLSTLSVTSKLNFDYVEVLSDLNYFVSDIASRNILGVFERMESILIEEYGEPYNNQYMNDESWYVSVRWFVKGKNEMIELLNNKDGSISLIVTESELEDESNY